MGLISSTTITSDTPTPKTYEYEMTLKFKLTSWDKPLDTELGVALSRILRDWNDGRYPFDVEMIQRGLHQCLKQAAYQVVQKAMQEKHGNEMIESADGRSQTAKWYLESQKVKIEAPYMSSEPEVKIERTLTKEEVRARIGKWCGCDKETERILGMSDEELST